MATKNLLVVDDDPAIQRLFQVLLPEPEWRIVTARSGKEALDELRDNPCDLVVTDIVMPGMGGLELLERMRQLYPSIPVVVMTAVNTRAHVLDSLRGRAYSYLSKPFTREMLLETVWSAAAADIAPDDIVVFSARPHWVSVEVRCKLTIADRLTQFFRELSVDLAPDERETISSAFRELLMNAIEHGGGADPGNKVHLTYIRGTRSIIYYIQDPGAGFSFDDLTHAAVGNPPGQPLEHTEVRSRLGLRPGGFGILLTRSFADDVIYNEKGNEVVLIKYLAG